MELLTIDSVEDAIAPLAYHLLKERQIAGASMVVVRAAAPKAELERIARNGGGGAGWGGEGVTSTSAELRGRLEPLVYCRGFGYANVESNEVIDVHKTPFDCGSCARILTAIAALQLWQEDHVELDRDVNHHLPSGLHVDNIFPGPVTLSRLMTHTSGFSDAEPSSENKENRSQASQQDNDLYYGPANIANSSLTRHLKLHHQVRVSPPGTLYRDCEHNYLLLGALIEHCSHMTFQRYMARNVLGPLSMTTIGVLPPPNQGTDSSDFLKHMRPTAYTVTNMQGRRVRLPLPPLPYPIPLSPVTGLVATPKEISNMLLACLQASNPSDPDSGGRGLLMEDSLGEMHAAHFRSQGSELAFGFLRRELWDDGPMLLFHSADEVLGADCLFCLFPEHRVGVWIGCNTTPEDPQDSPSAHADDSEPEEEQRFCEEILEAFIQRFFPLHGGKNAAEQSLWFYTPPPLRADPLLNLYCFPFVGGSAPVMYENWPAMLPDFIQVRTVQLPGRGSRVKEPPNGNMLVLAEQVGIAMLPLVSGGEPFAFFGHGMGAVLAYEVARYIQRRVGRAPLHFFCSGQVSPAYHSLKGQGSHSWGESLSKGTSDRVMGDSSFARPQRLHLLPDHDLAFTLASCTRISRQFRKNSLMLRAMMGTIRADIQAEESYQWVPHLYDGRKSRPRAGSLGRGRGAEREQGGGTAEEREQRERDGPWDGPALLCPMTIYVGLQDEHTSEKGLQGWQQLSRGPCQLQRLPGDHFYLEDGKSREHLLKSIGHTLVGHLSRHSNWITMMHAGNPNPRRETNSRDRD